VVYYVYILKLKSGRAYIGSTPNLKERLKEHQRGESEYTSKDLPVELISYICFTDRLRALRFERYLKTGSGRAWRKKHFDI
jgi:predicted GIY-YIG superfamily endonuclease